MNAEGSTGIGSKIPLYDTSERMRVRDLAEALHLPFEGDGEKILKAAAPIETAGAEEISFAGNRKALDLLASSAAACIIVPQEYPNSEHRTVIRSAQPRGAFARAVSILYPKPEELPIIHPTAIIASDADVPSTCAVGAYCSIGSGSRIGAHSRIGAGSMVGVRVTIGEGSTVHANVTIYDGVEIGARAVLHSGCVIGADGFGFVMTGDHYEKFPQVGHVVIGDDVEIGANSCVDRGTLGATVIGDGVKLDNLVHVAHNCRIGRHVVIAAQTGLSGGVVVEDYAVIGGQVGIGDKARIESKATLGSGSGVLSSKIVRSGQVVWGTPARPLKQHLEQLAAVSRLPAELEEIKRRLSEIEKR